MAYINVPEGVPGIRSLVLFRPETGKPLYELAQVLLRGPSPLTPAERELIAAYVSSRNNCGFCRDSHAAAARSLYAQETGAGDGSVGDGAGGGVEAGGGGSIVDDVLKDPAQAAVSPKIKALLNIAGKVQILGKEVSPDDVEAARAAGADDREIHDTVLIAATFSMFNRYVDGLASWTPTDPEVYTEMGQRLATNGYVSPKPVNQI